MNQKYQINTKVYNFSFEYDTGKLVCKELFVVGYEYMDGLQYEIIDEYRLIEEYTIKKYFIFKKKKFACHRLKSHIISDDKECAKIKFLHYFLKEFKHIALHDYNNKIGNFIKSAKILYNEVLTNNPEKILIAVSGKISKNDVVQFWS